MWDLKYRPLRFTDVLGQPGTVTLLKARLRHGTALDTSYVFSGHHGSGKTTLARIYARAMSCQQLVSPTEDPEPCNECSNCNDVLNDEGRIYVEKDAASNGTIEHTRAIVENLPFSVIGATKKIYTFDEAHRMSRDAQDVLLKPIEDKRLVAMFCTTEPEKIRGPILSRCEVYAIRKITREDILARMKWVLNQEHVEHEDDAILSVIDYSGAHVRDVMNRLEMISQLGKVDLATVREYLNLGVVSVFYDILLALHSPVDACDLIERACERATPDEIAAGIAEAAMNSYRLANGMHCDFVYVDRALGQKVWERYGIHGLRLAEHFLRMRHGSKAALLSDVLVLSQQPNNVPPVGVQPPVVFMVGGAGPALTPSPAPHSMGSAPVQEIHTPSRPSMTGPAMTGPVASAPTHSAPIVPPAPPKDPRMREDGVGPAGVDPLGLTPFDHYGVAAEPPRGPMRQSKDLKFPGDRKVEELGLDPLSPLDWRREFARQWTGRVSSG